MNENEIDIRSILGLFRRQMRPIIYITVGVIIAAAAYIFTLTPLYTATTIVLVDPNSKDIYSNTVESASGSTLNARVDSEVEILKSDVIVQETAIRANLASDPDFGVQLGTIDRIMTMVGLKAPDAASESASQVKRIIPKLRRATTISRQGLTFLIKVRVQSTDPERAAEISNIYAQTYISNQLRAKVEGNLAARDILQAQIVEANAELSRSEASFDNFIEQNLTRIETETGRSDITALREQLEAMQSAGLSAEVRANSALASLRSEDWTSLNESLQDQALAELLRQREELERQIRGADAGSPDAVNLRNRLAQLEGNLQESAQAALSDLRQEVAQFSDQANSFRDQIRSSVLSSDLPPELLTQIFSIQQENSIAREQYQQLLSSLRSFEAQAQLQLADSRIVSPALPPNFPSFPRKTLMLALAAALGLGLGVAVAVIREFYVGGFTSETQLSDVLNLKVASAAPIVANSEGRGKAAPPVDQIIDSPLSVFSEGVRRLRAAIDHDTREVAQERGCRIIMATSTVPGEGKSTTSLSLARTYALSGQKTILIDADMRKPSLARTLEMSPEYGLRAYLSPPEDGEEPLTLEQVIMRDERGKLDIIPGAGRVNQPTDQLLAGARFGNLLKQLSEEYDVIIIDTPPLLPVVDGRYIAYHVDAVVMVVKWADTRQQDVRIVLPPLAESLREGAQIYAFLNQQELASRSNYYRGYYQGYGYVTD